MDKRSVYLVVAPSQYRLAATFMRFQEHYESPQFRKRIFSVEEYMDWYAEQKGNFTYYKDWSGFNIPSRVLAPFYEGKFNPLLEKERTLLELFRDIKEKFYVIGVSKDSEEKNPALRHEFVHGLYYTVPTYKRAVLEVLRDANTEAIHKALTGLGGYHSSVLDDETNAYMLTGISSLGVTMGRDMINLRKRLSAIFREHFGFSIAGISRESILEQIHVIDI